ncbi:hypothetical protein GX408_13295, partial [bacterium]|nr:hypothetical protein [bacterium]
ISWTISDNQAWLTTNYTSGTGNQTITVTATSANPSTSSRNATVTITGSGFARTITVTQQGVSPYLTVNETPLSLGSEANSQNSFTISSNISWTISDNQAWLTTNYTSGTGNQTITVTATSANPSTSSRNATVTITGGGFARTITVTQQGASAFIKVASPNGGESYRIGESMPVRWNYSSDSGSRVYIDLYKGGQLYKHLKNGSDVGNDGDHDEVLINVTAGDDYKVRITSTSYSSIYDESDNYFTIASGNGAIPTSGLVASYPFNGNANDESGNGNGGIINGAAATSDRFNVANRAYYFDGINDYIDCGNGSSLSFSAALTMSFWIKFTTDPYSFSGGKIIIDKAYSWRFYYASDASTQEELADQIYSNLWGWADLSTKTTNWQTNRWYHITTTYDKISLTTYVDGVQQNVRSLSKSLPIASYHLFIGAQSDGPGSYFNGCIDDVRIYSRALNSSEVSSLYHENGW